MLLHKYASKSGLEHKCFTRRPFDGNNNNNIIERTLDAILTQIDSSSNSNNNDGTTKKQYVEYWTRQEWRHIEAHADVDENLAKHIDKNNGIDTDDDFLQTKYATTYHEQYGHRYPTYGHVLYLQVGSEVRGPTCVFPGRSSGGDLLKAMQDEGECSDNGDGGEVQLSIVPAVKGRLLRFDGRDLHAVPRPTDIWMLPFVKGGAEYEPEKQWGRSVILFNVWPGDEEPPLDVPLDTTSDEDEAVATDAPLCNEFPNWNEVKTTAKEFSAEDASAAEPNQSVKLWLLGNDRRRDYPMRTVPLLAPIEGGRDAVRKALSEEQDVTELWLRRQK